MNPLDLSYGASSDLLPRLTRGRHERLTYPAQEFSGMFVMVGPEYSHFRPGQCTHTSIDESPRPKRQSRRWPFA